MTNINTINTTKYIGNGIYIKDYTEYNKAVRENFRNTVKANPDKRYIFDPFQGFIEKKKS